MLKMPTINCIRDMSNSGYRISEIAKKVGIDRKTVRKYLEQEDFSPVPPILDCKPSMLDPYKGFIQECLD